MSDDFGSSSLVSSSERSPTRVSDFEGSQMEQRDDPPKWVPDESSQPSAPVRSAKRYPGGPTSQQGKTLPRLDESESFCSDDVESSFLTPVPGVTTATTTSTSVHQQNPQENEEALIQSLPQLRDDHLAEVEKLKTDATNLAARGKEEDAIQSYHRALRLLREDMSVLKKALKEYKDSALRRALRQSWINTASSLAEVRTVMAILYERLGEYAKAIKACEEAREVYKSFARMDARHSSSETNGSNEYAEQMNLMIERLSSARDSFEERKHLHEEAIQCLRKVARSKSRDKEILYTDVFSALNRALKMERESLGETHPQVADTVRIYSRIYLERGEIDQSIQQMKSSVDILRLSLGPCHPRTAMAARELARLLETRMRNTSDAVNAIRFYKEALDGFREAYGNGHSLVGATLNNIAVLNIRQDRLIDALALLHEALRALEGSKPSENAVNTDIAQVWKNLGECYSRRRSWENAHYAYINALEVQRDARRQADNSPKASIPSGCDDASLADTLIRLGKATKATMRFDDANMIYKEALIIYRVQYKAAKHAKGPPGQRLMVAQERLAHCLYCKAEVQETRGKYEEAKKMYSEAFQLRLNSDALREQSRANMVHCAMALVGIGSVHMRKGETDDACVVFKESLRYLDRHGELRCDKMSRWCVLFVLT